MGGPALASSLHGQLHFLPGAAKLLAFHARLAAIDRQVVHFVQRLEVELAYQVVTLKSALRQAGQVQRQTPPVFFKMYGNLAEPFISVDSPSLRSGIFLSALSKVSRAAGGGHLPERTFHYQRAAPAALSQAWVSQLLLCDLQPAAEPVKLFLSQVPPTGGMLVEDERGRVCLGVIPYQEAPPVEQTVMAMPSRRPRVLAPV